MASFTDIIPKFNPYIQQLPVEAMVQVGMEKQRRYDEGIQKIQSEIDNIAGLDIIRDVDREYLQSKLNELGNNLRGLAAGDFSNFQLVNSVSGMTNQVIKDGFVQNAVASTKRYRKGQEEVDAARKDGKSSPQNEAWWKKQVNDWLNDRDIKTSFTGQYEPYKDLTKKWMDVQKELGVSETTRHLPFYQDAMGRYTDANGNLLPPGAKPVLNDVMIEQTFKGKSPQAIKDAIMASMDESDIRQLNIDAWYHYRGVSAGDLRLSAAKDQKEYVDGLNTQMKYLETLKQIDPSNVQRQNEIQKEMDAVKADFDRSMKSYEQTVSLIDKNPDAYKNAIYSQRAVNQFAKSFSYMSDIQKIVDNPYQEKLHRDRQHQLAVDNYMESMRHHRATEAQAWANINLREEELSLSRQKLAAENSPLVPGSLQIPINKKDQEKMTLAGFYADLESSRKQAEVLKTNFKNTYFKDQTDQDFNRDYAFFMQNYKEGREVPAQWVQLFDQVSLSEQTYSNNASLITSLMKEVDNMPEFKGTISLEEMRKDPSKARLIKKGGLFAMPSPTLEALKIKRFEGLLQERMVQTYQPEALSFNTSDAKKKNFVKTAFGQFLTKIETSGGQEKTAFTKNFNLNVSKKINSEDGTLYGFIRQGNQIYLTMQGKDGVQQTIQTDVSDFTRVFGYSPVSQVQGVSDVVFTNGNTNPQSGSYGFGITTNPNAYKTAHFSKIRGGSSLDAFPMVSRHSIKADIMQLPQGNYQSVFYIQDPVTKQWVTRISQPSNDLTALVRAYTMINDTSIDLLLK